MIGICEGCELEGTVTEYVYINRNGKSETKGIFCPDCMCCSYCGEVLEPDRLAFMDTVQIKGMGIKMSVPARWCAACIRDCPDDPILESEKVQAEEWDVQP